MTNYAECKYDPTDFEDNDDRRQILRLIGWLLNDIKLIGEVNRVKDDAVGILDAPSRAEIYTDVNDNWPDIIVRLHRFNGDAYIYDCHDNRTLIDCLIHVVNVYYIMVTTEDAFTSTQKLHNKDMLTKNGLKQRRDEYIKIAKRLNIPPIKKA